MGHEVMGYFGGVPERSAAVRDRPRAFPDLFGQMAQRDRGAGLMVPRPSDLVPVRESCAFAVTDGRTVRHGGMDIPLLPGVRRVTGAAVKTLCNAYKRAVMFIRKGSGWQRVRDDDVIDLDGGEEFRSQMPVSRD